MAKQTVPVTQPDGRILLQEVDEEESAPASEKVEPKKRKPRKGKP
jgi:hypothetical protein